MKHSYLYHLKISLISLALAGLSSPLAHAENQANSQSLILEIQGNLDFYYQFSSESHSGSGTARPKALEGRYFDRNSQEPTLSLAEVIFTKNIGKVHALIGFGAGELVDQLSGGGSSSVTQTNPTNPAANEPTRNITQAVLSYQFTDRLSFSFGKFFTNIGFETTRTKENWQYSRSYLFNYGPFWHQGSSISYAIVPQKFSMTVYAINGWDGRSAKQSNSDLTLAANFNFISPNKITLNYNYIGGDESVGMGRRELHEVNALYQFNDLYSAAIDAQMGSQLDVESQTVHWSGVAVYFRGNLSDFYSFSPRLEYFDDADGFVIASGMSGANRTPQHISSLTLTNLFKLGGSLEARLEARFDRSSSDQFFRDFDGNPSTRQNSYTLAFLYGF